METDDEIFINGLQKRIATQHKNIEGNFIYFSSLIVEAVACKPHLVPILNQYIDKILDDCEIYFNMPRQKATDILGELSNYAAIYSAYEGITYYRICNLINQIRASYPVYD